VSFDPYGPRGAASIGGLREQLEETLDYHGGGQVLAVSEDAARGVLLVIVALGSGLRAKMPGVPDDLMAVVKTCVPAAVKVDFVALDGCVKGLTAQKRAAIEAAYRLGGRDALAPFTE